MAGALLSVIIGGICLGIFLKSEDFEKDLPLLIVALALFLAALILFIIFRSHRKIPTDLIYLEEGKLVCLAPEGYVRVDPADIQNVKEIPARSRELYLTYGTIQIVMKDGSLITVYNVGDISEVKTKILQKKFEREQENERHTTQID